MLVSEAIQKAYLHAQRKAVAPASGSTKYAALLAIADSMQKLWAQEPNTDWSSLYSVVTLAAVVTETDSFALTSTIDYLSRRGDDYVILTNGTNDVAYKIVQPDQLYRYKNSKVCAKVGRNLKFPEAFLDTDTVLGYSIKVPCYLYTADITSAADTVAVEDPMWLCYMMAAEFVRNDTVKQNQYENLLALADQVMEKMKQNNEDSQIDQVTMDWIPQGANW